MCEVVFLQACFGKRLFLRFHGNFVYLLDILYDKIRFFGNFVYLFEILYDQKDFMDLLGNFEELIEIFKMICLKKKDFVEIF